MIDPHGGKLVNRMLNEEKRKEAEEKAKGLPKLKANKELLRDMENIAKGVFSPIEGFLGEKDFKSVLNNRRLTSGVPWTIPIVFDADKSDADSLKEEAVITDENGEAYAIFYVDDKYRYDKEEMAEKVYGTTDRKHPGVEKIHNMKDVLIGGKIDLIRSLHDKFAKYNLAPRETRVLFKERGWKTICAFQTRNVPHLGHENLQKVVLGLVDGLLIHPIIGKKKKGDFKDHLILKAYDALIENYYNKDRVVLSILPTEMRYAGPREAILHAIMRKNYGCTHIIIGRDHAGVGNYYPPEAAIEIFAEFDDMEITPITIRGDFYYCKRCRAIASDRTCSHPEEYRINFSGTAIRKMIIEGTPPPQEIMRSEVFDVISRDKNPFVE